MTPDEDAAVTRLREILTGDDDVRLAVQRTFTHGKGILIEHRPIGGRWTKGMIDKGRPMPLLLPADGQTIANVLHDLGTIITGERDDATRRCATTTCKVDTFTGDRCPACYGAPT